MLSHLQHKAKDKYKIQLYKISSQRNKKNKSKSQQFQKTKHSVIINKRSKQ